MAWAIAPSLRPGPSPLAYGLGYSDGLGDSRQALAGMDLSKMRIRQYRGIERMNLRQKNAMLRLAFQAISQEASEHAREKACCPHTGLTSRIEVHYC